MTGTDSVLPPSADDFLQGAHIDTGRDAVISGEVAMWQAVLARVWADAWIATDTGIRNSDRHCDPAIIRAEARRWLLLNFGDFKADRDDVCASAGIDPDVVRRVALRRKKLAEVEDQERDQRERESIDRAMDTLAARAPGMMLGRVNRALRELAEREAAVY